MYKPREWGGPGPLGVVAPKIQKKNNNIYTQIGFTELSEITDCNKETKSRDVILHGNLQLVLLSFSSVIVHNPK